MQVPPPHADAAEPPARDPLESLVRISRAIGSVVETDVLVRKVARHVATIFSADSALLLLHDEFRRQLWGLYEDSGIPDRWHEMRLRDDFGLCGYIRESMEPLCLPDTLADPFLKRMPVPQISHQVGSLLITPMRHRTRRCEGVLMVCSRMPGSFHDHQLPLLEAIAVQVGIRLENVQLFDRQKQQFESFVRAFSTALHSRDPITASHSLSVANYAMGIAAHLRPALTVPEQEWLRIAGLLHDVGKIGVPEAILTKPGRLTNWEFELMKSHALWTRQILSQIEFIDDLAGMDFIAAAHHEKLDGSGYPDGLVGPQIPLRARILTVADVFDALVQRRHYRNGMTVEEALKVIESMTPQQLDQECVDGLLRFLGRRR